MTTKSEGMMIPGKLKWYVILALALWLAFSGVAAAEQLYVNESGWWRDDGAFNASGAPIQAAVDAAGAGNSIFVWNGSYSENVDVEKRLTLEGEGADVVTVTAADSGDHVFEVTADWVNISGFAARGATDHYMTGIYLNDVGYCNISGNNAYGNYWGIQILYSSSTTLTNNTANSNKENGIYLTSSSNNTLENNIANSNNDGHGIYLTSSSNNTLENNIANSNNDGNGIYLTSSSNNTLENNSCSNNYYRGIHMDSSSNNVLENNNASNNRDGIYICDYSNNNTLYNNTANSNICNGIYLRSSSNNALQSNTANLNMLGFCLYKADNNNIACNLVQNNNRPDFQHGGIYLCNADNNNIACNLVQNNTNWGFYLCNADNNNIACNLVQNNTNWGFYLYRGSTGNNISYNNVIENGDYNTTSGGWEWQLYVDQYNLVEAKHNYWGAGMNNDTIDASIYDDEEGGWGEVVFYPFETEPVPCAPTPEESHTFTAADAVIALQIAVGSRPPDPHWDVSGDGSVTSQSYRR